MIRKTFKYVFGPVVSRRLGFSLGIDLVPFKTCTYDCIYCQLGHTTAHTLTCKEYVPLDELLEEIRVKLDTSPMPDWVTLAGSGEPTLFSKLGELVMGIKQQTDTPIAVITNGSLLWKHEVQKDLLDVDLVIPSIDAGTAETFKQINRPNNDLEFNQMIEGLVSFRKRFKNQIWLEVFLVADKYDLHKEVKSIAGLVERIQPDKIQLNTVSRPSGAEHVHPVPYDQMKIYAEMLGSNAEVIAEYNGFEQIESEAVSTDDVLNIIRRHPCSQKDIALGLGIQEVVISEHLKCLLEQAKIDFEERNGTPFYFAKIDVDDKIR